MRLNDRSPAVQHEPKIKYRLGRFHARLTVKGDGCPRSRYGDWAIVLVLARRKAPWEYKSPSYTLGGKWKDLVSQLALYAVSLSDRISRYEREEVGSTPALRAILIVYLL